MGQTLSEPITVKDTASCSNSIYSVGSSSMQGWRINMEDAHTHILELPGDPSAAFFAVFDGHGGAKIARHASQHLHTQIVSTKAYLEERIPEAMIDGFLELDELMHKSEEIREEMSGSTAVAVLVKENFIYCANAGDSRAVASVSGRAIPLSTDHKPGNEEETRRIVAAGGWVEFNRVNGNLALSRALGDFGFKKNESKSTREQIVTACPEVEIQAITAEHEFILLACDGIWDVMSNQEVVDFCRERLANITAPEKVCEELLGRCLAPDCELSGLGCDNMTAILVCLMQDRPSEDYLEQLRKPARVEARHLNADAAAQSATMGRTETETVEECDMDEVVEEVFSTPSHSPPPALMSQHVVKSNGDESASDLSADDDALPTEFKVDDTSQPESDAGETSCREETECSEEEVRTGISDESTPDA